jgi:hypothetical protein
MIKFNRASTCLALFLVINLLAINAFAGLLDVGSPYYDGVKTWKGTTTFVSDDNPNLHGYVEWAVFAPGQFPGAFTGYTPTPGEFTYAYQIFEEGSDDVSDLTVYMANPADNIGTFNVPSVPGLAPLTMTLISSESADWTFSGIKLPNNGNSIGLAYSSPYVPLDLYAGVLDGGSTATVDPVPSPDTYSIPEPSMLALLTICLGMAGFVATKRRFSR